MAGGAGTRFWPISRASRPKQFMDILGTGKTFIRSTYERFAPIIPRENFLVVTNSAYKELVLEQIPELSENQVLGEPISRNTAPCILYAAMRLAAINPDAEMIVTPADHLVLNEAEFRKVIDECVDFVRSNDVLMTIGIRPNRPDTGYGYIQIEQDNSHVCTLTNKSDVCSIHKVKTFTEKPNLDLARTFVASGDFFWNAGIFIWKTDMILRSMSEFLPDLFMIFESIAPYFNTPREQEQIDAIYPECRGISIDFGVMEKAPNVYVRCSDFGWSDVGTWGSLYEHSAKDEEGNAVSDNVVLYDSHRCIVRMPQEKIAVIEGLDDYIIVENDSVLMICPRSNEQNIKKFIDDLKFSEGNKYI